MTDPLTIAAGVACGIAFLVLFLVICFALFRPKRKPQEQAAPMVSIGYAEPLRRRSISRDMVELGYDNADVLIGLELGKDTAKQLGRVLGGLSPAPAPEPPKP